MYNQRTSIHVFASDTRNSDCKEDVSHCWGSDVHVCMCFTLSGLRQSSVVKLLSYLRIRWIRHWLTDPPFSSSSSYLLVEQYCVWGYRRTQLGNHDYNTPQRDYWKMRSTWICVPRVSVCTRFCANDCTVYVFVCPCTYLYMYSMYMWESLCW